MPPALSLISPVQTSRPQQKQWLRPRRTTTTTLKPRTVPDRHPAYVHAPQRAAAARHRRHQRRASRTYGFLCCSALPHSHRHQTWSPRLTAPVAGGEVGCGIRPRGRARYWTGMRHRCPESGCVRGHVQAPVMRQKLRHGNCVVNSRCLKLNLSWYFVNESGIGKRR